MFPYQSRHSPRRIEEGQEIMIVFILVIRNTPNYYSYSIMRVNIKQSKRDKKEKIVIDT